MRPLGVVGPEPATRQILRKLIVGRLTCEAFDTDGQRGYRFTGQGTYEHLLPGKLVPTMVVTPAGFDSITSWATLPFEALALAP